MFYHEINYNIDYSRENQYWNAWGSRDHDLLIAHKIPAVLDLLQAELQPPSGRFVDTPSVSLDQLKVPACRIKEVDLKKLQSFFGKEGVKTDQHERVMHSCGQSYYDLIRVRNNKLKAYVDAVVYPRNSKEVAQLLDWASKKKISLVPYGGGSSVVGGVEALMKRGQKAILSVDMMRMCSMINVDEYSMQATFEAGIYGPHIEKKLNARGFTLGHFPQSFEYSTLGGWIAARSAGQQSQHYGEIDKLVASMECLTPQGKIETLNAPAGATGPDLNQILAGSEGLLGIITKATVRIEKLPESRYYSAILFPDLKYALDFMQDVNHQSLDLSMVRISDADETRLLQMLSAAGKNKTVHRLKQLGLNAVLGLNGIKKDRCLLMLGMDTDERTMQRQDIVLRTLIRKHNGFYAGEKPGQNWIKGRFNMPFLRNHVMEHGIGVDTLETTTHFSNVINVHTEVLKAIRSSASNIIAMCHLSHSYKDGACLYFSFLFVQDTNDPIRQWQRIKTAASDAILKTGANMSHHHGIGVDHKDHFQKQMSPPALAMLRAMKTELDPGSILNPGKLID